MLLDLGGAGMKLYAGKDLHSSNNYIGVINEKDERLYQKKLPNELNQVLEALNPFKKELESIVVESTYNWYWLVGQRWGRLCYYALLWKRHMVNSAYAKKS